jgi:hypothetical protein
VCGLGIPPATDQEGLHHRTVAARHTAAAIAFPGCARKGQMQGYPCCGGLVWTGRMG